MKQFEDKGDLHELVGLDQIEAHAYLKRFGWKLRVVAKDGQPLVTTRDYDAKRVNVELKGDHIYKITGLG